MHPKWGVIISVCLLVVFTLSTPASSEFQKQAEMVPQAQVRETWLANHFQGLSRLFPWAVQLSAGKSLGEAHLGDTFEADAEAGHQRRNAGNLQELRPGEVLGGCRAREPQEGRRTLAAKRLRLFS